MSFLFSYGRRARLLYSTTTTNTIIHLTSKRCFLWSTEDAGGEREGEREKDQQGKKASNESIRETRTNKQQGFARRTDRERGRKKIHTLILIKGKKKKDDAINTENRAKKMRQRQRTSKRRWDLFLPTEMKLPFPTRRRRCLSVLTD